MAQKDLTTGEFRRLHLELVSGRMTWTTENSGAMWSESDIKVISHKNPYFGGFLKILR